jgi:2,3-diaminopropionate biosynthesis protein SbnB
MIVIGHSEVDRILSGQEKEILSLTERAYELHDMGSSAVPHSVFLRFPGDNRNRVIGLPAYIGGDNPAAGMKWIASFPGNVAQGIERASAAIVLNSLRTGQPEALIEGSQVSAKRTAASAAVAARTLVSSGKPVELSLIGCGVINFEVVRFVTAALPVSRITVCDLSRARATAFAERCATIAPGVPIGFAVDTIEAVTGHNLVSIATTAVEPHMGLSTAGPDTVVLHLSLRDLYPDTVLSSVNVVDDPDHVCRERTSLHLAEQLTAGRRFINASIGALLRGKAQLPQDSSKPIVYSPFGLGMLDIALAEFVRSQAADQGLGTIIDGFLATAG